MLGEVGERSLEVGPDRLDRVALGGVGRELEDRQPGPGRGQLARRLGDVGVEVVPDQDERPAELLGATSSSRAYSYRQSP